MITFYSTTAATLQSAPTVTATARNVALRRGGEEHGTALVSVLAQGAANTDPSQMASLGLCTVGSTAGSTGGFLAEWLLQGKAALERGHTVHGDVSLPGLKADAFQYKKIYSRSQVCN